MSNSSNSTLLIKICTKCNQSKEIAAFYTRPNGSPSSACKKCHQQQIKDRASRLKQCPPDESQFPLEKYCRGCNSFLPRKAFGRLGSSNDLKRSKCKQCDKQVHQQWLSKNKKLVSEQAKNYKSTKEFKDRRNRLRNERKKTDPNFRLQETLRTRITDALRGTRKSAPLKTLLGVSLDEARNILQSKFPQNSNWTWLGPGRRLWHIDHIRPCDSFDLTDAEQQRICFHISNLQPLSRHDNNTKYTQYNPEDFKDKWIYANGYKWRLCDNKRTKIED